LTGNANSSDSDLAAELQTGSMSAGKTLYDRYHDSVQRYCHHLMHDPDPAKDAAHDTFIAAMDNIGTLRKSASFKSWLFRIARNECMMTMRRSSRMVRLEDSDDVWESSTPHSLALQGELQQIVRDAVDHLKPIYREAIVLREFEGLNYREIAETTEASIASVKFRLHRAREALANSLAAYLDERSTP
jgi:RNA polymerase sigma-70 factor (ECF subfamily)